MIKKAIHLGVLGFATTLSKKRLSTSVGYSDDSTTSCFMHALYIVRGVALDKTVTVSYLDRGRMSVCRAEGA